MIPAELQPNRVSWAGLWQRIQRERALVALFDFGRRRRLGLRAARWYAFGVFLSYSVALVLTQGAEPGRGFHHLVHAALISLSWGVGAPAALAAARALAEPGDRCALVALSVQRGFSRAALVRARTLAGAVRIARLVAAPALLLVALAVLRGAHPAWAVAVAPAVIVYAAALGACLAVSAYFAAELSPRYPRAFLVLLVLGPVLIQQAYTPLPSLPSLLAAVLNQLLEAGAELS